MNDASELGRFLRAAFDAMPPEMRAELQAEAASARRIAPKMTDEERDAYEAQQTKWFATVPHDKRAAVHHEAQEQRVRDVEILRETREKIARGEQA